MAKVTEAYQLLTSVFGNIDPDWSGDISTEEVHSITELGEEVLALIDSDGNGTPSAVEVEAFLDDMAIFDNIMDFNVDGDGQINLAEVYFALLDRATKQ